MSDINDEMKGAADYAIKAAKERFGQELDFSEQSIVKLENLLGQTYQGLSSRVKDEKTSNTISRTANIWGSYLGEFMRRKWGGTWVLKGSERVISIKNIEFSPIGFLYQKITGHPEYSVEKYLAEVERKLSPLPVIPSQSQNTITVDKKLIFTLAGIGGILLIIATCIVGFMIFNKSDVSPEFKSNLNVFLLKAEKLNILTEQGVSNSDFRNQLAEVKSAYSLLSNSWPSSLSAEKNSFEQAIKGWDLTLEVWDYGLSKLGSVGLDGIVLDRNSALLKDAGVYANISENSGHYNSISVKEWIGVLMGTAGKYFDEGKASIDSKLK